MVFIRLHDDQRPRLAIAGFCFACRMGRFLLQIVHAVDIRSRPIVFMDQAIVAKKYIGVDKERSLDSHSRNHFCRYDLAVLPVKRRKPNFGIGRG